MKKTTDLIIKLVEKFQALIGRFRGRLVAWCYVSTYNLHVSVIGAGRCMSLKNKGLTARSSSAFLSRLISKVLFQKARLANNEDTPGVSTSGAEYTSLVQNTLHEKTEEVPKALKDSSLLKMPIVFLHFTNSDYLRYSLAQAKHSNPGSTIYLIGDNTNDCYNSIEHHSYLDYCQGADDFAKVYQHFNTTQYEYELVCFQRWFILREFLILNGLTNCLYLDSDTMLYGDVTQEQKKYAQYDFTLSCRTSGCTFFLNRIDTLADFCQFLLDIYSKKEQYYFDRMLAQYAALKRNGMPGGACDMTAFDLFSYDHFGRIGEVAQVVDGCVFDPSINIPHPGFEMEKGIKKVIWKNGHPYGKQLKTGKEIRFNSLQFQGETKRLMGEYYTGPKLLT